MLVTSAVAWLCFAAADAAGGGSSKQLADLYTAMREREALYTDMELQYTRLITGEREPPPKERVDTYRHREEKYRLVLQGGCWYCKMEYDTLFYDGNRKKMVSEYGFDGETTLINSQGVVGNIVNGPVSWGEFAVPHRWGTGLSDIALVDYLQWSPILRADKHESEKFSGATTEILGEEELDGLPALKIRYTKKPRDFPSTQFYLIWIVPQRNYLPARNEFYVQSHSSTIPFQVVRVLAWREALPGIWLPERSEGVVYDYRDLQKGTRTPIVRHNFTLDSVKASPDYPIEFFREVNMAADKVVYTVVDGEIVKEVWRDEAVPPSSRRRMLEVIVAANVGIVLLLVAVWLVRRRRRQAAQAGKA